MSYAAGLALHAMQSPSGPRVRGTGSPKRPRHGLKHPADELGGDSRSAGSLRKKIASKLLSFHEADGNCEGAWACTNEDTQLQSPLKRTKTPNGYAGTVTVPRIATEAPAAFEIERWQADDSAIATDDSADNGDDDFDTGAGGNSVAGNATQATSSSTRSNRLLLAAAAFLIPAGVQWLGTAGSAVMGLGDAGDAPSASAGAPALMFRDTAPGWAQVCGDIRAAGDTAQNNSSAGALLAVVPSTAAVSPSSAASANPSSGSTGSLVLGERRTPTATDATGTATPRRRQRGSVALKVTAPAGRFSAGAQMAAALPVPRDAVPQLHVQLDDISYGQPALPPHSGEQQDKTVRTHPVIRDLLDQVVPSPVQGEGQSPRRRRRMPVLEDYVGALYADFDLFGAVVLSPGRGPRQPPSMPSVVELRAATGMPSPATSMDAGTLPRETIVSAGRAQQAAWLSSSVSPIEIVTGPSGDVETGRPAAPSSSLLLTFAAGSGRPDDAASEGGTGRRSTPMADTNSTVAAKLIAYAAASGGAASGSDDDNGASFCDCGAGAELLRLGNYADCVYTLVENRVVKCAAEA